MKKTLLLLTAVGLLAASCQKEESKSTTIAESQLLGSWRITYYKGFGYTNGEKVAETDYLLSMDSCKRDNLINLRTNALLYRTSGSFKCFPGELDTFQAGSWSLTKEYPQTVMLLDTSASGRIAGVIPALPIVPLKIIEISSNRLKLYRDTTAVVDGNTQSSKTLLVLER